jgi:DNA-binding transcriptional LysR family regulator
MEATLTQTVHLGVGIDTARYGHHVSFMNADRELVSPPLEISESTAGYEKLAQRLQPLSRKYPQAHFHVRLDAAGQYATNLEKFLRGLDLSIRLSIGEPKRNKDYHRAMSPKLKSDASESLAMARFAVVERPLATRETPEQILALHEIAGRLESQVKTCTQAINRFHNLLSRVFPELALIATNLAANWVLALLDKYPTPARIALGGAPVVGQDSASS